MEQVQIYNTLTRQKEIFEPVEAGMVKMYNCGPTVYDHAHIGNMRTYIMADTIRRVFEHLGYGVKQVMNITDVGHLTSDEDQGEDRMLVGARRTGRDPWEIAGHFSRLFSADTATLNILRPHIVCKATDHIPEMIDFVQKLVAKDFAYAISDGVYLDVSRIPHYGRRLSGQALVERHHGARVDVNTEKRHPADFAVWRKATPEHMMQWDSPWGRGFPGWHIECSVMSMKYLGETFDIHTGGEDHIAIHHENEIAQSEAISGRLFANYWLHGRFLRWVHEADDEEQKMSKSAGTFLVVDDLVERGFDPLAFRYYCLTASYRVPLAFSWAGLQQAADSLRRLRDTVRRLAKETQNIQIASVPDALSQHFRQTIANDFDMPGALAITWDTVRQANRTDDVAEKRARLNLLLHFDTVLGLGLADVLTAGTGSLPSDVADLIQQREAARSTHDWATADQLREVIQQHGYQIEDTPSGPQWRQAKKSKKD